MEITLFDVPMTDHSEGPTNNNSPDIFEDKSKDGSAAGVVPVTGTVAYSYSFKTDLEFYSTAKIFKPFSSALHNAAVLRNGEHEQELNNASEASFKALITDHSESSKVDVCDAEVVCLDEVAEQDRKSASKDPYESEYFNYYDSFVEQWYEPVDDSASNQVNYELKMPHESFKEGNQECVAETTTNSASTGSSSQSFIASLSEQVECVVSRNVGRFPISASSQDSFFDSPKFIANTKPDIVNSSSFAKNNHSVDLAPPAAHSTPLQPTRKKPRFGSNVKILKTTDITPMPDYDTMNDECLKNELRKFGLKPMGRKRSIAILKKIYEEIHPKIDPSTPTIRPLVVDDIEDHEQQTLKCKSTKERARGQGIRTLPEAMRIADLPSAASKDAQIGSMEENEDEDFIDLGDKTLNDPADEPPEESMIDDGLLPKVS
uniref:SAP domain-containing protein n=1 Tax=Angiostrongylus cantonensis TaxID=6313 RepID=A0A0K0D4D8_ANGCA